MALKLPPYALHSQITSARPLLPRSVLPFSSVVVSGTETTAWSMQAKRLNEMKQERREVSLYIWAERQMTGSTYICGLVGREINDRVGNMYLWADDSDGKVRVPDFP